MSSFVLIGRYRLEKMTSLCLSIRFNRARLFQMYPVIDLTLLYSHANNLLFSAISATAASVRNRRSRCTWIFTRATCHTVVKCVGRNFVRSRVSTLTLKPIDANSAISSQLVSSSHNWHCHRRWLRSVHCHRAARTAQTLPVPLSVIVPIRRWAAATWKRSNQRKRSSRQTTQSSTSRSHPHSTRSPCWSCSQVSKRRWRHHHRHNSCPLFPRHHRNCRWLVSKTSLKYWPSIERRNRWQWWHQCSLPPHRPPRRNWTIQMKKSTLKRLMTTMIWTKTTQSCALSSLTVTTLWATNRTRDAVADGSKVRVSTCFNQLLTYFCLSANPSKIIDWEWSERTWRPASLTQIIYYIYATATKTQKYYFPSETHTHTLPPLYSLEKYALPIITLISFCLYC